MPSAKFLQRFGGVLDDEVDDGGKLALVEPAPTHPLSDDIIPRRASSQENGFPTSKHAIR